MTLPEGPGPLGACYCSRRPFFPSPRLPFPGASGSGGRATSDRAQPPGDRGGGRRERVVAAEAPSASGPPPGGR